MVKYFKDKHDKDCRQWRGIFRGILVCYIGFLVYSIIHHVLNPWHLGSTCIVNTASERDMEVVTEVMIHAEIRGKRFLCRTHASFVSGRIGIKSKAPITGKEFGINRQKAGRSCFCRILCCKINKAGGRT
ncbi:hypothetical protein ZOSMA_244G00020 [Zostera marina]|uniref:Uncharacterized protein n=1 Tax=Zostera marina TaxID=29655 RepID=A0A0K9PH24_ZOSMR|nr:hypothetical protein ZOSMA_244G00020 [Zostera marina]